MQKSFLFILFSIFITNHSYAQSKDAETIKKLNRDWLNSIIKRDTASLSKILAEDFLLINPGGMKQNKAENLANLRIPNMQVLSINIDSSEVKMLSADIGIINVWTNNQISADGKKKTLLISYQDVYRKRKNKWQAVAAHVMLLKEQL
jgi:ketosteroid isomerase-like protein